MRSLKIDERLVKQLLRFGSVGIFLNVLGIGLFHLINSTGLLPSVSFTISYLIMVFISYISHKKVVFKSKKNNFYKYLVNILAIYVSVQFLLYTCVTFLEFNPTITMIFLVLIFAIINFAVQRLSIF